MLQIDPEYLLKVFLIFVRIGGLLLTAPFFDNRAIPVKVKVFLSVLLAHALVGLVPSTLPPHATTTLGMMVAVAIEALTGVTLGFSAQFIFWTVQFAGEVLGFQLGLSLAKLVDPINGVPSNPIGRLLALSFMMIFLLLDGHHHLLRALMVSFEAVPLAGAQLDASGPLLLSWTGKFFLSALQLAAPFMITIFLIDTTLGILARVAPQMDLFAIALPSKLLLGLVLTYFYMQYFFPVVPGMTDSMLSDLLQMVETLVP